MSVDAKIPDDVQNTVATLIGQEAQAAAGDYGALSDNIDKLANAGLQVDDSFFRIEKVFDGVLAENPEGDFQKKIVDLQTTWKDYRQNFLDLIWRSRKVAGTAEASCRDYATTYTDAFLLSPDFDIATKRKETDGYAQSLDKNKSDSADLATGFANLGKNVNAFKEKWAKVVADAKKDFGGQEQKFADEINKKIAEAKKVLDAATAKMGDAGKTITTMSKVGGIVKQVGGFLGFVMNFVPIPYSGIISKVIGVVTDVVGQATSKLPDVAPLSKAVDVAKTTLLQLQKEKAEHESGNMRALEKLETGLTNSKGDFDLIVDRLAAFSGVWSSIQADLGQIKEVLDSVNAITDVPTFVPKCQSLRAMYVSLADCFAKYQTTVQLKAQKTFALPPKKDTAPTPTIEKKVYNVTSVLSGSQNAGITEEQVNVMQFLLARSTVY